MLGYSPITSAVTKIVSFGIKLKVLTIKRKSSEPYTWKFPFCIMDSRWESKNSDTSSVGAPQFDITDCPGTSNNFLCILGKRDNSPKKQSCLLKHISEILQAFIPDTTSGSLASIRHLFFNFFHIILPFPYNNGRTLISLFSEKTLSL